MKILLEETNVEYARFNKGKRKNIKSLNQS